MNQIRTTSSLAVTSLVAGLLGLTLAPVLGTLVAIITGHMARSEIRRSGGRLDGDGMAVAGLVLGWVAVAFWLLGLMFVFLVLGGIAGLAALA